MVVSVVMGGKFMVNVYRQPGERVIAPPASTAWRNAPSEQATTSAPCADNCASAGIVRKSDTIARPIMRRISDLLMRRNMSCFEHITDERRAIVAKTTSRRRFASHDLDYNVHCNAVLPGVYLMFQRAFRLLILVSLALVVSPAIAPLQAQPEAVPYIYYFSNTLKAF